MTKEKSEGKTMRNNFKIAYRFIKSNKAQTILIALGIALGVTVQYNFS